MPLPQELLEDIGKRLDEAKERMKSIEDVIADLRASGIDATKQEAELDKVKENFSKLSMFYGRQSKRISS